MNMDDMDGFELVYYLLFSLKANIMCNLFIMVCNMWSDNMKKSCSHMFTMP